MADCHKGADMLQAIKREVIDTKLVLRDYPPIVFCLFVLSLVAANLMANKELVNYKFLALDCGTAFSWVMFLCMDATCAHYGSRITIKLSVLALSINLGVCAAFALLSLVHGNWGQYYATQDASANAILDGTFCGSPYIVFGSGVAFVLSSVVNAKLHEFVAKKFTYNHVFQKGTFSLFAVVSYISTFVAQFCDNFTFSTIVSKVLFGWTWTQVVVCSLIQAVAELLCEVFFSPLGYRWVKNWQRDKVGSEYFKVVGLRG